MFYAQCTARQGISVKVAREILSVDKYYLFR